MGAPDDRHGDRRAVAVLAEIIATDAGAGVQAAAEKGAERRQIAGAERLVEARLPGATAEEVGDARNEFEAQGFVAVAVGQVVDRVDDVVGEGGSGAGEAAARDLLLREREGEGVEVVLFVTITGARDRAEGGVPEGQLGIVNGGTPPARGLVAVVGERGRVGEEELLEARIGNRGVGDGGMGKNAVDVDEDGAGIHAEALPFLRAGQKIGNFIRQFRYIEEIHQSPCMPVFNDFTDWRSITSNDGATHAHRLQKAPAEREGIGEINVNAGELKDTDELLIRNLSKKKNTLPVSAADARKNLIRKYLRP